MIIPICSLTHSTYRMYSRSHPIINISQYFSIITTEKWTRHIGNTVAIAKRGKKVGFLEKYPWFFGRYFPRHIITWSFPLNTVEYIIYLYFISPLFPPRVFNSRSCNILPVFMHFFSFFLPPPIFNRKIAN